MLTRVFSDFHLGHKLSRIDHLEAISPLIAGADEIVFNGDTWQEISLGVKPHASSWLQELQEICQQESVNARFLSGNHDPGWKDSFLSLYDGKVIITHGDALLRQSSPWKREIMKHQDRIEAIWKAHPHADTDVRQRLAVAREIAFQLPSASPSKGKSLLNRVCDAAFPPSRALHMLDAWLNQAHHASDFAQQYFPQSEVMILGHFHRRGTWEINNRLILNTGSFMNPGKASAIEIDNGWIRSLPIIESSANSYHFGAPQGVWRLP